MAAAARLKTPFTRGTAVWCQRLLFMKSPRPFEENAVQLRQRAEECRRDAEHSPDPIDRDTLLALAHAFEQLAALAEAKLASRPATTDEIETG